MQLVYFWIEKNGVLENQGINFNSGFYFEMKKDDDIYVLERKRGKEKEIPKSFFGEKIENISCIIGDNGGGKTTLIRAIINSKYTREIIKKYILVYEDSGKFYIKKNINNYQNIFEFISLLKRELYIGDEMYYIARIYSIENGINLLLENRNDLLKMKNESSNYINKIPKDTMLLFNMYKEIENIEEEYKNTNNFNY